jgi:serine/threonine protein kinase
MVLIGEHPHVANIEDVYEDRHYIYIVMELLKGGELFDRIRKLSKYTESDARRVFRQMVQAVDHLHTNRIAHCDIQPSNFLFATSEEDACIKMIDFGMSARLRTRPNKYMSKARGTLMYAAPEVLRGKYYEACDMWSLGVTLFVMTLGYPPFNTHNHQRGARSSNDIIRSRILAGFDPTIKKGYGAHFPADKSRQVSSALRDLLTHLLTSDPARRLTSKVFQFQFQSVFFFFDGILRDIHTFLYTTRHHAIIHTIHHSHHSHHAITIIHRKL